MSAPGVEIRRRAFAGGTDVDAEDGRTFDCVNSATGELPAQVAVKVDAAVPDARAAFESGVGSRSAPKHRKRMLPRMAELVSEHAGENSTDSTTIRVQTG